MSSVQTVETCRECRMRCRRCAAGRWGSDRKGERDEQQWERKKEEERLTWRQVLGVATGVHQNIGLKGGVKVVICTEEGTGGGDTTCWNIVCVYEVCVKVFLRVLPVVEEDVWCPDLICGEAEVFHSRMFTLVPLEIVVEPTLKHTDTHTVCIPVDYRQAALSPVQFRCNRIRIIHFKQLFLNFRDVILSKMIKQEWRSTP